MKYVIYLRVSTDDQDVRTQEQEIMRYVSNLEKGKQVQVNMFVDEDVSTGKKMSKRPQLMAMLASLQKGQHVVVYKLDRLSRDVIEMVTIYRQIKAADCYIHSLHDSNADDEFMIGLMGVLAQKERSDIRLRIQSKMNAKKERNERCSRHVPYGYKLDMVNLIKIKNQHDSGWSLKPGLLVEEPVEQMVLLHAKELLALGNSYRRIANILTQSGYRNRVGKPFQHMSLYRILCRTGETKSEDQFHEDLECLASH